MSNASDLPHIRQESHLSRLAVSSSSVYLLILALPATRLWAAPLLSSWDIWLESALVSSGQLYLALVSSS